MFLKKTYVNQGSRRYLYGQVVRSIRRASDGKPAHRVVASLGAITEALAENLQRAFKAARQGKAVVISSEVAHPALRPTAHLSYLNVAILLQLWRRWGLDQIAAGLEPDSQRQLPFEDALAALVLHRCLDPASKIEATRWFPRTALPELLGRSPSALNNTRVHRALQSLADGEEALQHAVASRVLEKRGRYLALFVDVTDTWFTGKGPALAETRKTKEGLWRLKVGIVLVCTQEGLPVRWKVLAGRQAEQEVMLQAGDWLRQGGLAADEPLVIDRIMGQVKSIAEMKAHGIRYVTALRSQAIHRFLGDDPVFALAEGIDPSADGAERQLGQAAQRLDMVPAEPQLWARDFGLVDPSPSEHLAPSPHTRRAQDALRQARDLRQALDHPEVPTWKKAAAQMGITAGRASAVRPLLSLAEPIQQAVVAGRCALSVKQLRDLSDLPEDEQLARFSQAQQRRPAKAPLDAASRVTVFFHPRRFIARRRDVQALRQQLERQLEELNERLATPHSRRTAASIEREVRDKLLKPKAFEALFEVVLETYTQDERERTRVRLTPNEAWHKARRLDGFLVLVAHPDAKVESTALAKLYTDRNTIEFDFRTIKSALRLRPVYVHTDPKVCAHVSICMLALFLHRALELELGPSRTAEATLKTVAQFYLNPVDMMGAPNAGAYTLTRTNKEQLKLLTTLKMESLIDLNELPAKLSPR